MAKNTLAFIKKHKFESIAIILIVLLSLFLRLYRISEYMTFLGDEGRDVRIVRDLLHGNLVFIGPQTSVGNMYLGPFYYYLIAPALFLSNLNPVGPAILIALLGGLTVYLTWYFARSWFNPMTGLIASFLTAIAPVAIIYNRSSWNPNPIPLFSLISMWFTYQFWLQRKYPFLIIATLFFGLSIQLHYLGLLLAPVIGVFWLLEFLKSKNKSKLIIATIYSFLVFLATLSPLILFDIKHQGSTSSAFRAFFSDRQTTINVNPANSDRFLPTINQIISEVLLGKETNYLIWATIAFFVLSVISYFLSKNKKSFKFILTWIFFAFLGLGLYKQHVYAHYFGFVQPALFILVAVSLATIFYRSLLGKIVSVITFIILVTVNFYHSPLKDNPNHQLQRTEAVVDLIIEQSDHKDFNFGLIAKQNYDESYRYFLENKGSSMIRAEDRITEQMFVVCEDGDQCQPLGNPQWQIAAFGVASINRQWNVDGIKVYQLIHTQNGK